jgi:hypothetical protein
LFCNLHWPLDPSLNEIEIGVMASSVKVAQPTELAARTMTASLFKIRLPWGNLL